MASHKKVPHKRKYRGKLHQHPNAPVNKPDVDLKAVENVDSLTMDQLERMILAEKLDSRLKSGSSGRTSSRHGRRSHRMST